MQNQSKKTIHTWIWISFCFFILTIGILTFVSTKNNHRDLQTYSITFTDVGFDTPVQFQATCSKKQFSKYSKIVEKTYKEQNNIFDPYSKKSLLYKINQADSGKEISINKDFKTCFDLSIKANTLCSSFDISQGNVLQLWHSIRESEKPHLPTQNELSQAQMHQGLDQFQIKKNKISKKDAEAKLDLGGIAKGYASELCKQKLNNAGLHNGFINAGGNVVLLGEKSDGSDWTIGIQNPETNASLLQFTTSRPLSMVTSGDYQRFVEIKGKNYSHIIDPKTGYPAHFMRSVTIIDEDSAWADAMSTSLFCMDVDQGIQFCKENHLQAVWITDKETEVNEKPILKTKQFNIYATSSIQKDLKLSHN